MKGLEVNSCIRKDLKRKKQNMKMRPGGKYSLEEFSGTKIGAYGSSPEGLLYKLETCW